jgi:hypothetical protein
MRNNKGWLAKVILYVLGFVTPTCLAQHRLLLLHRQTTLVYFLSSASRLPPFLLSLPPSPSLSAHARTLFSFTLYQALCLRSRAKIRYYSRSGRGHFLPFLLFVCPAGWQQTDCLLACSRLWSRLAVISSMHGLKAPAGGKG